MVKRSFRKNYYKRKSRQNYKRRYLYRRKMFSPFQRMRPIHTYTRYLGTRNSFLGGGTGAIGFGHHTLFTDLINYTDFTYLYDQFRITKVQHIFTLMLDAGGTNTNNGLSALPRIYYDVDRDDSTAPTTDLLIRERSGCKMRLMSYNRPLIITYTPNTLSDSYNSVSGLHGPGSLEWFQWKDMNNAGQHMYFGLKAWIENLGAASAPRVLHEVKITFQCRKAH